MRGRLTVICCTKGSSSIFSSQFHSLLFIGALLMEFFCDPNTFYLWRLLPNFRDSTGDHPMIRCYHPIFRKQLTPHIKIDFSNTYHSETCAPWFSDTSKAGNGKNVKRQRVKAPWLRVKLTMGMPNRLNSRILGMDHRRSSHAASLSPNQ